MDMGKTEPATNASTGALESSENSVSDEEDVERLDTKIDHRSSAKRRIIDETLLNTEDAKRLETRRAYNRQCAAKARRRSKDLISRLQEQVDKLTKDKAELERTNEVMRAQMQMLEQQNHALMMNQSSHQHQPAATSFSAMAGGLSAGSASAAASSVGLSQQSLIESLTAQRLAKLQADASALDHALYSLMPPTGGIDPKQFFR